jgi:hypothetical protein
VGNSKKAVRTPRPGIIAGPGQPRELPYLPGIDSTLIHMLRRLEVDERVDGLPQMAQLLDVSERTVRRAYNDAPAGSYLRKVIKRSDTGRYSVCSWGEPMNLIPDMQKRRGGALKSAAALAREARKRTSGTSVRAGIVKSS